MQPFMKNDAINGSLGRAILAFVGPFLLSNIIQNLYGAIDLLIVGQFATTADVSAVTIGSQIMSMATQFIVGLSTGTTVLVGRYLGAQDEKSMAKAAGTSVVLYLGMAILLTGAVLLFRMPIVSVMQTPIEAINATSEYILVCALGLIFIVGYNIIASILMGLGNTKTPLVFIVVACVINILLDIVLVRDYQMGALGAAIATMLAQAGSVIIGFLYIRSKGLGFKISWQDMRINSMAAVQLIKIGGPIAVQNMLVGASFLFITAVINQMGVVASASAGVVEKLIGFLIMPAVAFGAATATLSAQNIGAGKVNRAKKTMVYGAIMALAPSIIIVVICQLRAEILTSFFSKETSVILQAADYLRSYVIDILVVSIVFSMNGYFNGSGKAWFTLFHSLLTTFAGRVPLCYLFSKIEGASLYAIGWAAPLSSVMSLFLCMLFLHHQNRLLQKNNKML